MISCGDGDGRRFFLSYLLFNYLFINLFIAIFLQSCCFEKQFLLWSRYGFCRYDGVIGVITVKIDLDRIFGIILAVIR